MSEPRLKVLVVDDEPIVIKRLKSFLEKEGLDVEVYSSSLEAWERIKTKKFDLLITDLKMEGIDGLELLTKAQELYPDLYVVVITGFATTDTANESFKKGVFDFLAKPFRLSDLKAILQKIIEDKNAKQT